MVSISYVKGDATAPAAGGNRIICHVCNDVGGWGRGFVMALSARWPEPERAYRTWYAERGTLALGELQLVQVEPSLWVANMVAQRDVRAHGGVPPLRYDALRRCLAALSDQAQRLHASVHMPRIGCGLAGGSWPEVEALIEQTLLASGTAVQVYDP